MAATDPQTKHVMGWYADEKGGGVFSYVNQTKMHTLTNFNLNKWEEFLNFLNFFLIN